MKPRAVRALLVLGWLVLSATAAQAAAPGPARVDIRIERVHQLGPIYPLHPAGIEVQLRNVGKTDCAACQVRVLGGRLVATQAVPLLRAGETAGVSVTNLRFPIPGKVVLVVGVDGPPDRVTFTGKKPSTTFEITVLEGAPAQKKATR